MSDTSYADALILFGITGDLARRKLFSALYDLTAAGHLDMPVVGWAFHDGAAGRAGALPDAEPPYATGVAALEDGHVVADVEGRRLNAAQGDVGVGARRPLGHVDDDEEFRRRYGALLISQYSLGVRDDSSVVQLKNAVHLGIGAGLLGAELVTGEGENGEALVLVVFVKRTQTCVLRREASFAGDVDDQADLISIRGEAHVLAGDGLHLEVVQVGHGRHRSGGRFALGNA